MSYIKSAVILNGIARIVEVHGATWLYLDIQAYGRGNAAYYRDLAEQAKEKGESPVSYLRIAEDFERTAENPYSINSGLAQDILKRKLSPVSSSNKRDWLNFALEEDCPGNADYSDRSPAVLIDLDMNRLSDTRDNFYAEYQRCLPEGWSYRRLTPDQMALFLTPRLAEQDKPRLGSPVEEEPE